MKLLSAQELNAVGRVLALEKERRKYKRLNDFMREAWRNVEGPDSRYCHNWHLDMLCERLEAFYRRDIKNLLVNVPPGSMKSILGSVCFHPWAWTDDPSKRFLTASYAGDLAVRDNVRSRELIATDWYQGLWGSVFSMDKRNDSKTRYHNLAGGWRIATSVGGRATGEHPDYKIVDDPHNVREAESDVEREAALIWFDLTLSLRGASRDAGTLVIMQRLHAHDLAGHIMELPEFKEEWQHVCLPMEYEPERMRQSKVYMNDPRKDIGALMWPELFPKAMVDVLKLRLGVYGTAGQMQQRPSPPGGGILKVDSFRLWSSDRDLPDLEFVLQSYDTAFTEKTANDPTACTVWGIFSKQVKYGDGTITVQCALLLDAWDERMEYPALRRRVMDDYRATYGGIEEKGGFKLDHPARRVDLVLVEEKGSGISLLQDLRQASVPARAYDPGRADKVARAHLSAPLLDLGVLYVMESTKERGKPIGWAREFLKQLEEFDKGEHDDYVDSFTQAMIFFKNTQMLALPTVPADPTPPRDYHRARDRKSNPYAP